MAFGDVMSSLSSRFSSRSNGSAEKPLRKVSWRSLFGFTSQKTVDIVRETAWLDGLRGVAAFLVMTYHFNLAWYNPFNLEEPWGNANTTGDLWRLPFLRLWMCSGHAQVSTFFVLSGFVLSWGPLATIRAGRYEKFVGSLGSATFRRWLRLYLPCFAVAGWYMLTFWFHIIDIGGLAGIMERQSNFFLQFWDYLKANQKFANPFNINRNQWSALHDYEATMWTIPYEFAGSLLVFLVLLGTCRVRSYARRTVITVGVSFYAMMDGQWAYWLFASGIVVADYVRQGGGFAQLAQKQTRRSTIIWSGVFIFALFLAGFPEPSQVWSSTGYHWIEIFTPPQWMDIEGGGRFWWCWAGILIIMSASHLPGVQRVFDNSVSRYLGRVSYMLYLTHRIVLDLLGKPLKAVVLPAFGRKDFINAPVGPGLGHKLTSIMVHLVMFCILAPIAIFVAHWVQVFVDEPSVVFAKWVETQFTADSAQPPPPTLRGNNEEGDRLLQPETELLPTHNGSANHSSRFPA